MPVVAVVGGAVVGVAHGGPNRGTEEGYDGELYLIYVRREAQGWGLGRRLTTSVASDLMARGFSSMIVWVLADNPSRRFYESLGGVVVGSKDVAVDQAVLKETAYGWPSLRTLQARLMTNDPPPSPRA
jgi:ribosomal protein S18 acetylase RimI-like enzyme